MQLTSTLFSSYTDIDECALGTDNCDDDSRAECTNTAGSFTCACLTGYSGDGVNCTGKLILIKTDFFLLSNITFIRFDVFCIKNI